MKQLWAIVLALAIGLSPAAASAQASASVFTSATRYDLDRRVTGTIAPDPDSTGPLHYAAVRNTYDDAGRLITVEKGELAAWQSEATAPADWTGFTIFQTIDTSYDALYDKTKETTSSGGTAYLVTQYVYDQMNRQTCSAMRMTMSTFAAGLPADACTQTSGGTVPDRITQTVYDANSRVTVIRKALGTPLVQNYVTYTYTPNGKQASVTDANGNRAEYGYDGHDRLARWSFPSKTVSGRASATDHEDYGYDLDGNRTSLTKRGGTVLTFGYDALDRMTSKLVPDCAGAECTTLPAGATRDVYYGYDLRGLQTFARFDSATGADAVLSSWTGFGELAASTTAMGGTSRTLTYSYDADGNRLSVQHPDAAVFSYQYDGLDRVNRVLDGAPATIGVLTYDAQGRRLQINRITGFSAATAYGYDPVSRLASLADSFPAAASNLTIGLGYNTASQITTRTQDNDGYAFTGYATANRPYTVNGLNQYASVAGTAFTYDANGNLASAGSNSYVYDRENRLVVAFAAQVPATLTYDPTGRLYEIAGTTTRRLLYDGDDLTAEYDTGGNVLRRYVHGPGADEPLLWYEGASVAGPARRYLFPDEQGSIVAVTGNTGTVLATNVYDDWGVPGAGNLGWFQYTGQGWVPELKLYYYKARFYDPANGRFLQTDPVGYDDQVNLYAYVANDPIDNRDPSGKYLKDALAVLEATAEVDAAEELGGTNLNPAVDVAQVVTTIGGLAIAGYELFQPATPQTTQPTDAGHRKGARPSTREKHQNADTRRKRDQERNAPTPPQPKNPSTYPSKDSPDYLRPGPKPKPPKPPQPPAPKPPKKDD